MKKTLTGLLVGIVFLAVGIFTLLNPHDDYLPVTATIVEIEQMFTENDSPDVYVDYTVDGTAYEHVRLGSYSSGYYEGKEIDLLYNPANPAQITTTGGAIWGIVLTVLGGLITLFFVGKILYPVLARR
ncbi:MAG: DUF3592 domain-containing protein [Oscillospiraceae bacterium]|nr:DUF3592 domain-containing protein [Oscillospiraceae bacterium]